MVRLREPEFVLVVPVPRGFEADVVDRPVFEADDLEEVVAALLRPVPVPDAFGGMLVLSIRPQSRKCRGFLSVGEKRCFGHKVLGVRAQVAKSCCIRKRDARTVRSTVIT